MAQQDADMATSSDSEESDFLDVDVSEADMNQIMDLEAKLEKNPDLYDAHVQFIAVLRKCGMRERLREARRAMQTRFPLSESLWLDWITDELDVVSSEQDIPKVLLLLEEAHQDYLSVPLWIQHVELVRTLDPEVQKKTPEGLGRVRAIFERAITACGLHIPQGSTLWHMLIDFELEQLAAGDPQDQEQIERVRNTYLRRLDVPLPDSDAVFEAYASWERAVHAAAAARGGDTEKGTQEEIEASLRNTKKRKFDKVRRAYELRQPFEEALVQAAAAGPGSSDLLAAYMAYIKVEESSQDSARVKLMYERAIAAFPVTHFLWLQYGRYVEGISVHDAFAVYGRACRNCPWVGDIWARVLRLQERSRVSDEEQAATYAAALTAGLQGPEDFLAISLARADALRRQGPASWPLLHSVFSSTAEVLKTKFPDSFDPSLSLTGYWAECEVKAPGGSIAAGRKVWEDALKTPAARRHGETWLRYAQFEQRHGDVASIRKVYAQGHSVEMEGGGQAAVCQAWLQFEREQGTADEYYQACLAAEPILISAAAAAAAAATAAASDGEYGAARVVKQPPSKEEQKVMRQQNDPNYKRRQRDKDGGGGDGDARPPPAKKAKPAPKKPATSAGAGGAGEKKPQAVPAPAVPNGGEVRMSNPELTAFVKRLASEVDEAAVQELFTACGEIVSLKMSRDKATGHHKGFAHVEFATAEGLEAACKLDSVEFHGKKIVVVKSRPPTAAPATDGGGRGAGAGGMQGGRGRGGRGRGAAPKSVLEAPGSNISASRTAAAFIPRAAALQRATGADAAGPQKTNAEFRDMLLSKK